MPYYGKFNSSGVQETMPDRMRHNSQAYSNAFRDVQEVGPYNSAGYQQPPYRDLMGRQRSGGSDAAAYYGQGSTNSKDINGGYTIPTSYLTGSREQQADLDLRNQMALMQAKYAYENQFNNPDEALRRRLLEQRYQAYIQGGI